MGQAAKWQEEEFAMTIMDALYSLYIFSSGCSVVKLCSRLTAHDKKNKNNSCYLFFLVFWEWVWFSINNINFVVFLYGLCGSISFSRVRAAWALCSLRWKFGAGIMNRRSTPEIYQTGYPQHRTQNLLKMLYLFRLYYLLFL